MNKDELIKLLGADNVFCGVCENPKNLSGVPYICDKCAKIEISIIKDIEQGRFSRHKEEASQSI